MVGTEDPRLVVLRGNSASGKSFVAAGIRDRFGRGLALVGQDNLRRIVLREGGHAPLEGMLTHAARGLLHQRLHCSSRAGRAAMPRSQEMALLDSFR